MNLLTRHLLKEFLKIFLLSALTLIMIYLLIDFLEKVRILIRYKAEPIQVFRYFLYKIPKIVFDTTPMAVLISTLITFGIMARNNELTALKSAGTHLYRVAAPVLVFSFIIALGLLYANTDLIPSGIRQAEFIRAVYIEKGSETSYFRQDKIWFRVADRVLFNVQLIDPEKNKIQGIGVYKLSDSFSLLEEIDARELVYENGNWFLISGIKRKFLGSGRIESEIFEKETFPLDKKPEDFRRIEVHEDRLKYSELRNYVEKLSAEGYVARRYSVDLYGRLAFPFVSFIMALVAVPFGMNNEQRAGGISKGIGISLAIGFSYWIIYAVSISLGHSGMLPPFLSAWVANFLFCAIGVYLLLTVRQ